MAGSKTIVKRFNNFRGKDLRASDLVRDKSFAIDFINSIITKDLSLATRRGSHILGDSAQHLGLSTYTYSDLTTGETKEEIVSISDKLLKRQSNTFTIDYAGAASPVIISVKLDANTATFKCVIIEGTTTVVDEDLGTGLESVPVTLADLKTVIDAVTDFSATISGVTTTPAAFLPITLNKDLAASPNQVVIAYYDWATINSSVSTPFAAYLAARGDAAFEHASFANFQDVLLIATGKEYLHKYDGQTVYRVGLPRPAAVSLVNSGAGNVDAGTHSWRVIYRQKDNRGNITESKESVGTSLVLGGASNIAVTISNVVAGTGFNTNCATVNGNQVAVTTITVNNSPHTLKVGDTSYFIDRATGLAVERLITSTAATTITIAGGNVNVNNGDAISNNLRILLVRTKVGGNDLFTVTEIPNNSLAATQVYADNIADANLGAQYFIPFKAHDLLDLKPHYVISHQGVPVVGGFESDPNTVGFGNTSDPETFPLATNFFDVASTTSGRVSGLASDEEHLIVGKKDAIYVTTGTLDTNNFSLDKLTEGAIGIICHNTIADIGGAIVFLSRRGWYLVQGGFNLVEVGEPVNKLFYDPVLNTASQLRPERSFAVFDKFSEQYICFIPTESGSNTGRFANSFSAIYVFDTFQQAWIELKGPNMGGGMCVAEDLLWWQSKRSDAALTVTGNLWARSNTGTEYDFADHHEVVNFELGDQWEDAGEPSRLKTALRLRVYNLSQAVIQTPFVFTVKTERDYLKGLADSEFSYSFDIGTSSGGWGYFPWGMGGWGSATVRIPLPKKLRNNKFRSLRFVFTHGKLLQRAAITGYEYELVMPYRGDMTH